MTKLFLVLIIATLATHILSTLLWCIIQTELFRARKESAILLSRLESVTQLLTLANIQSEKAEEPQNYIFERRK